MRKTIAGVILGILSSANAFELIDMEPATAIYEAVADTTTINECVFNEKRQYVACETLAYDEIQLWNLIIEKDYSSYYKAEYEYTLEIINSEQAERVCNYDSVCGYFKCSRLPVINDFGKLTGKIYINATMKVETYGIISNF